MIHVTDEFFQANILEYSQNGEQKISSPIDEMDEII